MEPQPRPERPGAMKPRRPVRAGLAFVALLAALTLVLAACHQGSESPTFAIHGHAAAGPTCPVEPPSPIPGQCEPRVVAGAVLVITDTAGREVTRVTTGADGRFAVQLPAGDYTITPQPFEGLLGIAPPVSIHLTATGGPGEIDIEYDTGIR